MSDSSARAARAREALVARHAELQEVLDHWAGVLAVGAGRGDPVRPVLSLLRAFLADEVLPHARAEERTLYRVARRDPGASPLLQALIGEHHELAARAGRLDEPTHPAIAAAEAAAAISALFASHVAKEHSLLLPALERSGADLGALLAREPRLTGEQCAAFPSAVRPGRNPLRRTGCLGDGLITNRPATDQPGVRLESTRRGGPR